MRMREEGQGARTQHDWNPILWRMLWHITKTSRYRYESDSEHILHRRRLQKVRQLQLLKCVRWNGRLYLHLRITRGYVSSPISKNYFSCKIKTPIFTVILIAASYRRVEIWHHLTHTGISLNSYRWMHHFKGFLRLAPLLVSSF